MRWAIYRIAPDGEEIQLTTVGYTSSKERATEKVNMYNKMLEQSDPTSEDKFIAKNEKGTVLKSA